MAITYYPQDGTTNTAASFASYVDKMFGYADHASSDTAFMMQYTGTAGGLDTYKITAGSYLFNGYLFTAAGTETLSVTTATNTECYLCYIQNNTTGALSSVGIYKAADLPTAGAGETRNVLNLWTLSAGGVVGAITDKRQVFTWGRQSVASTAAGCVDFLSARTVQKQGWTSYNATYTMKRFRCGYPGTVQLTYDGKVLTGTSNIYVYRVRNGVGTLLSTDAVNSTNFTTFDHNGTVIKGLMPGDYIDVQGAWGSSNYQVKNFRIRYTLRDITTAAVLID